MASPDYHPPVKRSITIKGHATSISLEPVFWDRLKTEAAARNMAVNALVAHIDLERMQSATPPGLASAIRVWLAAQVQAAQILAHRTRNFTILRAETDTDYRALGQLMFDAVHAQPSPYSAQERAAWMPKPRAGTAWNERLSAQYVLAAYDDAGEVTGFMSLDHNQDAASGYVDFAYIAGAARGRGLFRALYQQIEIRAVNSGIAKLSTHASLMAQPAFAAMGFASLYEEQVEMHSAYGPQQLRRFAMEKLL